MLISKMKNRIGLPIKVLLRRSHPYLNLSDINKAKSQFPSYIVDPVRAIENKMAEKRQNIKLFIGFKNSTFLKLYFLIKSQFWYPYLSKATPALVAIIIEGKKNAFAIQSSPWSKSSPSGEPLKFQSETKIAKIVLLL